MRMQYGLQKSICTLGYICYLGVVGVLLACRAGLKIVDLSEKPFNTACVHTGIHIFGYKKNSNSCFVLFLNFNDLKFLFTGTCINVQNLPGGGIPCMQGWPEMCEYWSITISFHLHASNTFCYYKIFSFFFNSSFRNFSACIMYKIYLEVAFLACTCKADLKCLNISQDNYFGFFWVHVNQSSVT